MFHVAGEPLALARAVSDAAHGGQILLSETFHKLVLDNHSIGIKEHGMVR